MRSALSIAAAIVILLGFASCGSNRPHSGASYSTDPFTHGPSGGTDLPSGAAFLGP